MTNGDRPSFAIGFSSFSFFLIPAAAQDARMKSKNKIAHLLPCHLALAAHGAVDVAACLPMAMEQLHYLLVNSSVRTGMCTAQ